jgi:hypothetical protein
MQEILSYDEIKTRYDGEWVLIVNPVLDENLEVIKGEVWAHFFHRRRNLPCHALSQRSCNLDRICWKSA